MVGLARNAQNACCNWGDIISRLQPALSLADVGAANNDDESLFSQVPVSYEPVAQETAAAGAPSAPLHVQHAQPFRPADFRWELARRAMAFLAALAASGDPRSSTGRLIRSYKHHGMSPAPVLTQRYSCARGPMRFWLSSVDPGGSGRSQEAFLMRHIANHAPEQCLPVVSPACRA